ncbi:DUF6898 family protein [Kordiimonas pumila]|uniref:DUF6898 family protein n=1 Tax=Kordiimonas pumila TaxID=2161677 RepID=A0ABV7D1Z5_9PROT|nr:hypothetical protein [Kordiimonas pumila]
MAKPGNIIVEFITIGNTLKVCAICERTGREVSIVGDPKAPRAELERIAVQKLRYVMERDAKNMTNSKSGLLA